MIWRYVYSDFSLTEFDSYIITRNEIEKQSFHLLDVVNRVTLPIDTDIRFPITAADILHSWAIPSLGIEADATSGRLNQVGANINRTRISFGQCSEICGANHRFIPIVVESCFKPDFIKWIT